MKARIKNVTRGIKSSLNRFLSILFIVALGSGFMAGLAATSPDMYETADKYMDEYDWYDIDIKSTLGFNEDNVTKLRQYEKIDKLQPSKVFDIVYNDITNDTEYTSRCYSFIDNNGTSLLNKVHLIDGRMPTNINECVIQSTTGDYMGKTPQIGDTFEVTTNSSNYSTIKEYLKVSTLQVVGIVEAPMCISVEQETTNVGTGSIGLDVYVKDDFYNCDFYTDLYLTYKGAKDYDAFDDSYEQMINETLPDLEAIGKVEAPKRVQEIKDEYNSKIEAIETQLQTTFQELKTLEQGLDLASYTSATQIASVVSMLMSVGSADATTLASLLSSLSVEYSEYATYLACKQLVDNMKEEVNKIGEGTWIIRTRQDAVGFSSYSSNVGKVAALSKIFPVFFFVVALLVALTTMTRLVDENRTQIGTLKALGFSNGQILGEYLLYSLLASLTGCILGLLVGFQLFPTAISSAYGMMYWLPKTITPFRFDIALTVGPITVVSILLATFWAVYANFKAMPSELMIPKAPTAGKRILLEKIPFIWKRLSFTHKVTCRNLFRYKKRLLMTIIGVAGCSALLLTGFGVKDSVNDIVSKQFDEIYQYDLTLVTDKSKAPERDDELHTYLDNKENFDIWSYCMWENGKVIYNNDSQAVSFIVPENKEDVPSLITLRERKTKKTIEFTDDGIVLTEKLCETLGIKVHDKVTLENDVGEKKEFVVSGICENYLTSFAYISSALYSNTFNKEIDYTYILALCNSNADVNELSREILFNEHVLYTRTSASIEDSFADSIKSINGVVWVLIISAGLLCIVVLYNLINVNICERRHELATIKVLGFHQREVERYIFRETNTLSVMGCGVGLLLGIWLHQFVVKTVEVDMVMFGRTIYPLSYLFAIGITIIFTLIVDLIMKLQIKKIDMVEAMKSNE